MKTHRHCLWAIDQENNLIYANDARHTVICNFMCSLKNDEVMADARLIAAAPELLTSLILMVRTHDEPAETLLQETKEQLWLEQARAVIAKVEGK